MGFFSIVFVFELCFVLIIVCCLPDRKEAIYVAIMSFSN